MKVRIYNSLDVREIFQQSAAYRMWFKTRPEVTWSQCGDFDYIQFDHDVDALAFKLAFNLHSE